MLVWHKAIFIEQQTRKISQIVIDCEPRLLTNTKYGSSETLSTIWEISIYSFKPSSMGRT